MNPRPAPRSTRLHEWLRRVGLFVGSALVTSAVVGVVLWRQFTDRLPSLAALEDYAPAEVTVLFDRQGRVLGELYDERRYVLPIDQIPRHVQDAFIAAEDASFRTHGGVDYIGIVRAAKRNADDGRASQGASTITQQVVKNLILEDRSKTIERKLKEVALAWEVEERFTKDEILFFYLNSLYLGAQSYGVEAAARTYFGRRASDLTIAQAALLAGLPQRPSDYNPYKNMPAARRRQEYTLDQMEAKGFITAEQAAMARAEEIVLTPPDNHFLNNAPHFTEHARRLLMERFGEEQVVRGGLRVFTTCDLDQQQQAQLAVSERVAELDRKSGYRRANRVTIPLDEEESWRAAHPVEGSLEADRVYEALVVSVANDRVRLAIGEFDAMLAIEDHRWISPRATAWSFQERLATNDERNAYYLKVEARKAKEEADRQRWLDSGVEPPPPDPNAAPEEQEEPPGLPILQEGDVVQVTITDGKKVQARNGRSLPRALLHQERELEGSLLSMELDTGAVRALVGGADFNGSQFNRATQARRQVGSTFKPFVYGAAVEARTHTAATIVPDEPISIKLSGKDQAGQEKYWSPQNHGKDFMGPMTMAKGLALSRNLVLVRTLVKADPWMDNDVVYDFARKLGLGGPPTGELPAGASATPETDTLCPWTAEWVSATFCRDHQPPFEGEPPDMAEHREEITRETPHLCRSCDYSMGLGSASLTLEEMVRAYSAFGAEGRLVEPYYIEEVRDRKGNTVYKAEPKRPQVLDPGVAYIVNFMLRGVVERGTATDAKKLKVPLAGKTGTTDEGRDTWFIGMSSKVITGVWVGFDTPQTIGERATGGRVALPIWQRFMTAVVTPEHEGWPDPPKEVITFAQIDESTGGSVSGGGRRYPFLPGTVPRAVAAVAPPPVDVPVVEGLD